MSESLQLVAFTMVLATVLVVFAMKYISTVLLSRTLARQATAYIDLSQKVAATQSATQMSLTSIQAELSEIGGRMTSIIKILEEVE